VQMQGNPASVRRASSVPQVRAGILSALWRVAYARGRRATDQKSSTKEITMKHCQKVRYYKRCGITGLLWDEPMATGIFIEYADTDQQYCRILNEHGKIEIVRKDDISA